MEIKLSEELLVELIKYSKPEAFRIIYTNYRKALLNVVFRITKDREISKDICQEVFLKAWTNLSGYDADKGRVFTWLVNIARNHCTDHFRSKGYRVSQLTVTITPAEYTGKFHENLSLVKLYVKDLLSQLIPVQKELIEMLYLQGFTQQEVSDSKAIPLGTIKTRSRKVLHLLRHMEV